MCWPTARDHVAALYCLGRAVRGLCAEGRGAPAAQHQQQRALHAEPTFAALLAATLEAAPRLNAKGLSRVLLALGDTHEDLPFAHLSLPDAYTRLVLAISTSASERLLAGWSDGLAGGPCPDDRDLAFPLFALARLGVYRPPVFRAASRLLARKLEEPGGGLPAECLRQWLLACGAVGHRLAPSEERAVARCPPIHTWLESDSNRLHQLAGAAVVLRRPDPLLAALVREVNARPPGQIQEASRAEALYGLQAMRLLATTGALPTEARLDAALAERLDAWLEEKSRRVRRRSRLERAVGAELERGGFQPTPDVSVGHGLSADFRCLHRGQAFYVEVDGPSHYCVRPVGQPLGRTLLKRRLFAALGLPLVPVPYWAAGLPGASRAAERGGVEPLDLNVGEMAEEALSQLGAAGAA
ncbi:unnamed protein product [Prorocentrum cordatum]|uniref:RAP domain-containing protein n=1 Tax=Prorocentrum cordatum TaxID=2364126 RepID=A0ABN9VKG5_9DINO|nr:unnamed protein product [Polarella glacialis]